MEADAADFQQSLEESVKRFLLGASGAEKLCALAPMAGASMRLLNFTVRCRR
jgi:hypothetical protein